MSRELKRVAANFSWPLHKVWNGFLNPHYQHHKKCPFCDGSGLNEETKKISDAWYSFDDSEYVWVTPGKRRYNNKAWQYHITQDEVDALIKDRRLMDFTHTWSKETGWVEKNPPYHPTADEINEWARKGIGHDSINQWVCVRARAERLGVYGQCEHCLGEGSIWRTSEDKKNCDAWEATEPPAGDWYQVWETTSEGSPISPAFETPEELAHWLVDNEASTFAKNTATYEQWMKFIQGPGWAPSAVFNGNGLISGVEAI